MEEARRDNVRIGPGGTIPDPLAEANLLTHVQDNQSGKSNQMMDDKNRQKALEVVIAGVEKEFGKGAVMRMSDGAKLYDELPVVSSGSVGLDVALGIGGYPRGRIVEIYGPESSGKTSLALHAIASAQAQGGVAAFIDAEHALDINYARKLGVRTDDLLVSQPDYGEQALEIADMLVKSGALDVIVVDSVAALVPKSEIEGDMGDSHVGLQARLMSQALRKLTGSVSRSRTLLIFINQIRMKIGVMFGSPETTTGGNALKFYASVRLDIRRIGAIKEASAEKRDAVVVGNRTRVKVVKNKLAPPFREVEFDILYGKGINKGGDLLDLAVSDRIVEKSGAWYSYEGQRLGQGRDNVVKLLTQRSDLMDRIRAQVLAKHGLNSNDAANAKDSEAKKDPEPQQTKKKSSKTRNNS